MIFNYIFTLSALTLFCSLSDSSAAQIGNFFIPPFEGAESAVSSYTSNINLFANLGWVQYVADHSFSYPSSLSEWLESSTIFSYTNLDGLTSTMSKAYEHFPKSEYIEVLESQAFPTEYLTGSNNPFSLFSQIVQDATAIVTTDPNGSTHTITFTSASGAAGPSSNSSDSSSTEVVTTSNAAQSSEPASETSLDNHSHTLSSSNSMKLATFVFCVISVLLCVFL